MFDLTHAYVPTITAESKLSGSICSSRVFDISLASMAPDMHRSEGMHNVNKQTLCIKHSKATQGNGRRTTPGLERSCSAWKAASSFRLPTYQDLTGQKKHALFETVERLPATASKQPFENLKNFPLTKKISTDLMRWQKHMKQQIILVSP